MNCGLYHGIGMCYSLTCEDPDPNPKLSSGCPIDRVIRNLRLGYAYFYMEPAWYCVPEER